MSNFGQEQDVHNAAGMASASNADPASNVDPAMGLNLSMNINPLDAGLVPMPDGMINPAMYPPVPPPGISSDEIALYDRQIRLWGVEAQQRIRDSKVLLVTMKGLGNEVAKNLVLAGIGSLTIVDDGAVTEEDLGSQFLIREEHLGQSRAQAALPQLQKLNPRVDIIVASLENLFADPTIFAMFTLVIATDMSLSDQQTVNTACRVQLRPFYAASTMGMYGYIFADLISHDFVISRQKGNVPTKIGAETATRSIITATTSRETDGKVTELVKKREIYSPLQLANTSPLPEWYTSMRRRKLNVSPILSCFRALWDYQAQTGLAMPSQTSRDDLALFTTLATNKHKELQLPPETLRSEVLRSFLANLGSELSPACAFLGGRLAQDVINVIGGKEQPIQNLLIFDGEESKAPIYAFSSDLLLGPQNAPSMQGMAMQVMGNGVGSMPLVGNVDDPSMLGAPMMPPGAGAGMAGGGVNGAPM